MDIRRLLAGLPGGRVLLVATLALLGVGAANLASWPGLRAQTAAGATVAILSPAPRATVARGRFDVTLAVGGGSAANPATLLLFYPKDLALVSLPAGCSAAPGSSAANAFICAGLAGSRQLTATFDASSTQCGTMGLSARAKLEGDGAWATTDPEQWSVEFRCEGFVTAAVSPAEGASVARGPFDVSVTVGGGTEANPATLHLYTQNGAVLEALPPGCSVSSAGMISCYSLTSVRQLAFRFNARNAACGARLQFGIGTVAARPSGIWQTLFNRSLLVRCDGDPLSSSPSSRGTSSAASATSSLSGAAGATVAILSPGHGSAVPRGAFDITLAVGVGGTAGGAPASLLFYLPRALAVRTVPAGCTASVGADRRLIACLNITSDRHFTVALDAADAACGAQLAFNALARLDTAASWSTTSPATWDARVACDAGASSSAASSARPAEPVTVAVLEPAHGADVPRGEFDITFAGAGTMTAQFYASPNTLAFPSLPERCSQFPEQDRTRIYCDSLAPGSYTLRADARSVACGTPVEILGIAGAPGGSLWNPMPQNPWAATVRCGGASSSSASSAPPPGAADVRIEFTPPREATALGGTFRAAVRLVNTGQATLRGAVLRITSEPGGPETAAADPRCSAAGAETRCLLTLEPNAPLDIALDVTARGLCGRAYPLTFDVFDASGLTSSNATAAITPACPRVVARPSADNPATVELGVPFSVLVRLENAGDAPSGDFSLHVQAGPAPASTFALPQSDARCHNGGNGGGSCDIPSLAGRSGPGGSSTEARLTLTVTDRSLCGTTQRLTGKLWGIARQEPSPDDEFSVPLTVTCTAPTLRATLSGPDGPVTVGQEARLTLTLRNLGPGRIDGGVLTSVGVANRHPSGGLTANPAQPDPAHCAAASNAVRCSPGVFPGLDEGRELSIPVSFLAQGFSCAQQLPGATWPVEMVAAVSGRFLGTPGATDGIWLTPAVAGATVTLACPAAVAVAMDPAQTAYQGNSIILRLTVQNPGQGALAGAKVRVAVPAPFTPAAVQPQPGCAPDSGGVLCTLDLPPGTTPLSVAVQRPAVACALAGQGSGIDGVTQVRLSCP